MMMPKDWIDKKVNETMSTKNDVQEQLTKLGIPQYVVDLQIATFDKRLDVLKKEKNELESISNREQLIVTLHPTNLPSGQISVRELTVILGGLQNLSDSIANTLFNQPSEKGKIPQEILDQNEFILTATVAGSFKAILELRHPDQLIIEEPVQTQTITELFKLMESSSSSDSLAEIISQLGPRALKNYVEWTKSIKELNTKIDIEWFSSFKTPSKISFDVQKAERVYSILSDFSETVEEEITITGKLTGANVRTKNFEIVTEDGDKVTGRIARDAIEKVSEFGLNKKCIVNLLKVTIIGSANREKVSWTLRDINSP